MKITILGCGGSFGSPLAWNRHGNIDLDNKRNFRTRSSVLIEYKNTNMIFLKFSDGANSQNFIKNLEKEGVLSGLINDKTVRLVFHKDISTDDLVHVKEKIYSSSLI